MPARMVQPASLLGGVPDRAELIPLAARSQQVWQDASGPASRISAAGVVTTVASALPAPETAEEADDEHERQLQELQVAAQNQQVARDAAAQIAAESGLGPQEQKRLERQIFARMNEALQMEVEAASPQSQQDDDEDEYYEEHDYYQQPQQAYQPALHDRIRRPGHSPRVSGKPTSSPPSASYGFPPMAAGGYREAAASFNATASSIAGGIFG